MEKRIRHRQLPPPRYRSHRGPGPLDGFPLAPALDLLLLVSFLPPLIPREAGGVLFIDAVLTLWFNCWHVAQVAGLELSLFGGLGLWLAGI